VPGVMPQVVTDGENTFARFGDQHARVDRRGRERLFDEDVVTGRKSVPRVRGVESIGRCDHNGVAQTAVEQRIGVDNGDTCGHLTYASDVAYAQRCPQDVAARRERARMMPTRITVSEQAHPQHATTIASWHYARLLTESRRQRRRALAHRRERSLDLFDLDVGNPSSADDGRPSSDATSRR
jgi:hypothetical protein